MRGSLSVLLACVSACALAHAEDVSYTLTGTFSGQLGAVAFSDARGTFTFTGSSSGVVNQGAGFYTNTDGTSSFAVDGLGTAVFLSPSFGAESEFGAAGFYDTANAFGAALYDPGLQGYGLSYPFHDTAPLLLSFATSSGISEATSLGELTLMGDFATPATFAAAAVPTPEPDALLLLATGAMGGAVTLLRRRSVRPSTTITSL